MPDRNVQRNTLTADTYISTANRMSLHGCTIVFDLDGTVADTAGDLIDAANAALVAHGLPAATSDAIKPGVGYGTKAMLRSALTSTGRDVGNAVLQQLADALVAHYESNIAVKTKPFPFFEEAADALRRQGATLALCTNKRQALALKLIAALRIEHLFDATAGGDTYPFHKPDPRHITSLIESVGGNCARAIMVGDSEADIAAAQAAGIPSIAVAFGYAALPAEQLGASAVLQSFQDLPALAERFLALRP